MVLPSVSAAMDAFVVKGNGYSPAARAKRPSRCCLGISYSISRVSQSRLWVEFRLILWMEYTVVLQSYPSHAPSYIVSVLYIYIYIYIYIYVHTHTRIYIYIYNMCVYMFVCIYVYMYICIYTSNHLVTSVVGSPRFSACLI